MFTNDTPINNPEEDYLNIQNFAKNLAINMENYFKDSMRDESLTIGISGEQESGKTSLLNLMEKSLKKEQIIIK